MRWAVVGNMPMTKIFANTAKRFESTGDTNIEKAIDEASTGQRPVIEELLNRDLVPVELFL